MNKDKIMVVSLLILCVVYTFAALGIHFLTHIEMNSTITISFFGLFGTSLLGLYLKKITDIKKENTYNANKGLFRNGVITVCVLVILAYVVAAFRFQYKTGLDVSESLTLSVFGLFGTEVLLSLLIAKDKIKYSERNKLEESEDEEIC